MIPAFHFRRSKAGKALGITGQLGCPLQVDVKIILLNNGVLGMVSQWQRMFYGERYSQSQLKTKLDFIKLADAMGIKGMRVTEEDELDTAIHRMFATEGAVLLEVVVPPKENVLPMVAAGKPLNEMVLGAEE